MTGSHNFKAGLDQTYGSVGLGSDYPVDARRLYTLDGAPFGVDVLSTPMGNFGGDVKADMGIFAQDSWTLDRLTLNLGYRYDYYNGSVPAQQAPAGTWVPERDFPSFPGPVWHTGSVRLGGAYDVSGDGRTALKANLSQFVASEGTRLLMLRNPMAGQSWAANV